MTFVTILIKGASSGSMRSRLFLPVFRRHTEAVLVHCTTDWKSCLRSASQYWLCWTGKKPSQPSKFQIECTCPSGKWIVKITCPNVPFTCLKYIKPMQLMWKSEICSRPSDKSCRYSTCPTVIFTCLRRSEEWNVEPCHHTLSKPMMSNNGIVYPGIYTIHTTAPVGHCEA